MGDNPDTDKYYECDDCFDVPELYEEEYEQDDPIQAARLLL